MNFYELILPPHRSTKMKWNDCAAPVCDVHELSVEEPEPGADNCRLLRLLIIFTVYTVQSTFYIVEYTGIWFSRNRGKLIWVEMTLQKRQFLVIFARKASSSNADRTSSLIFRYMHDVPPPYTYHTTNNHIVQEAYF